MLHTLAMCHITHYTMFYVFAPQPPPADLQSHTSCWAEQLHDLEDVVGYLRSLGWHLVSLLGHSKAGTIVVQYAALHPVPCVVAISARFFQDQGRYQLLRSGMPRSLLLKPQLMRMTWHCGDAQNIVHDQHQRPDDQTVGLATCRLGRALWA